MKQARSWAYLSAFCLLSMPLFAGVSSNELKLGSGNAEFGSEVSVPLTLDTTDQVQGLVAAFDWDGALGTGAGLDDGAGIAGADSVFKRIEADYMVLAVVVDINGSAPDSIGPGPALAIATARITCGQTAGTSPVVFRDGLYASANGGPVQDNVVVVGGLSFGASEGLTLTDGSFSCLASVPNFSINDIGTNGQGLCCAQVLMKNDSLVEAYQIALCHPADLTLASISLGAAATAQGADFNSEDISAAGGVLGVVIDLVQPFTDNMIPAGPANHIATYCYSFTTEGVYDLTFCDNVLGSPLKENLQVIDGTSVNPELRDGTIDCRDVVVPPGEQMFACGSREQDEDGIPGPVEGTVGQQTEVCFYIKSPEDSASGHAQFDHIQGFSMAVSYCCDVSAEEVIDIEGTIVEAIGAEFVSIQVDNDPNDGDGCELIIGVLVDASPPFDGQTIPPLPQFQLIGCVPFNINDDDALCDTCCPVMFTDGVNGRGKVPTKNLISVENESRSPQLMNCEICIVGEERFCRGDCNFSNMGMMCVDISDAASVVSFLFLPGTWKFEPPCLDACDCNDDGRIDLADAVCILQYLFTFGMTPPAPGPGWDPDTMTELPNGPDPTDDKLDCAAGRTCD